MGVVFLHPLLSVYKGWCSGGSGLHSWGWSQGPSPCTKGEMLQQDHWELGEDLGDSGIFTSRKGKVSGRGGKLHSLMWSK